MLIYLEICRCQYCQDQSANTPRLCDGQFGWHTHIESHSWEHGIMIKSVLIQNTRQLTKPVLYSSKTKHGFGGIFQQWLLFDKVEKLLDNWLKWNLFQKLDWILGARLLLDYYNHINYNINYTHPKSGLNTEGSIIRPVEQKEDIRVGPVPTEVKVEWDTGRKNSGNFGSCVKVKNNWATLTYFGLAHN